MDFDKKYIEQQGWDINDFTVVDWQNNRKKVQAEYLPEEFFLTSFPNPFNPVNNIVFKLDSRSFIDISIFNTNGEKIYTILLMKNWDI